MPIQSWSQVLVSSQADGSTLTAAAAASCIPAAAKYTLPANFLDVLGKSLKIRATGRISSIIMTPGTARFSVKFGATTVFDGLAVLLDTAAAHTTVGWTLDIDLILRVVGASAQVWGQGLWTCEDILGVPSTAPKGVLSAILPWNSTPALGTAFDSTASQQVDLFFTQTEPTGSLTVHTYKLISEN